MKLKLKLLPGMDIEQVAVDMMDFWKRKSYIHILEDVAVIEGDFNGICLTAKQGTTAKDIIGHYYNELHRREEEAEARRKKLILFMDFERVAYKNFFDKVNANANLPQRTINDLCRATMDNLEAEKKRLGVEV